MRILDLIFCDDIRHEISNKHTIVGTYNDQIIMESRTDKDLKLPIPIKLAFYLKVDLQNETRLKTIEFKFSGPCSDFLGSINLKVLDHTRPMILAISSLTLNIIGAGKLETLFVFKDSEGVALSTIKPEYDFFVIFKKMQ